MESTPGGYHSTLQHVMVANFATGRPLSRHLLCLQSFALNIALGICEVQATVPRPCRKCQELNLTALASTHRLLDHDRLVRAGELPGVEAAHGGGAGAAAGAGTTAGAAAGVGGGGGRRLDHRRDGGGRGGHGRGVPVGVPTGDDDGSMWTSSYVVLLTSDNYLVFGQPLSQVRDVPVKIECIGGSACKSSASLQLQLAGSPSSEPGHDPSTSTSTPRPRPLPHPNSARRICCWSQAWCQALPH